MKTYEMMIQANITGKTFVINDLYYNKDNGFHDIDSEPWEACAFDTLNEIFEMTSWEEVKPIKMTLEEIEAELGYKIELVS